jgi:hypothetical protein
MFSIGRDEYEFQDRQIDARPGRKEREREMLSIYK